MFGFYFHFLFSFSKNYFYFQKIRILKICLVWLLIFCFQKIKNTENAFSKGNVFLDFLKITFLATTFSFYPKWGSRFHRKHWKWDFIVSHFWFVWKNIFTENKNRNSIKHIFITLLYFQWKWKQKITKPNAP